jgi:hypothetical protein
VQPEDGSYVLRDAHARHWRVMKEIRVKLEGDRAQLGEVPAADVARLMLSLEKAAQQSAAIVLRQPKTTTGRYRAVIEQAVHFRLVGIEQGSVVPVLELPAPLLDENSATLDVEVPHLGEAAVEALLAEAAEPRDPLVAKALLDLADNMLLGERYDSITFNVLDRDRQSRTVKVDGGSRKRLREYVDSMPMPKAREDDVVGLLFEANFERRTALLRTPTEAAVEVTFSDDQADLIQAALRQNSTVRGDVTYDPKSHIAKSVRLTEIVRGIEQLALDPGEFWRELSFEELAERQGSGRPVDPDALHDEDASAEERDAFIAALAEIE